MGRNGGYAAREQERVEGCGGFTESLVVRFSGAR